MEHKRKQFLFLVLGASLLLALLDFWAIGFGLYTSLWWVDLLIHFWGGCLIVLLITAVFLYGLENFSAQFRMPYVLFFIIGAVFVVGVGWEIFEYVAGIADEVHYVRDTTSDLAADLFGGAGTYLALTRSRLQGMLQ